MARSSSANDATICIIIRPAGDGRIDVLGQRVEAGARLGDPPHDVSRVLQ